MTIKKRGQKCMEVRHTPFAFFLVKKHKFKTSPGTVYGIFGY